MRHYVLDVYKCVSYTQRERIYCCHAAYLKQGVQVCPKLVHRQWQCYLKRLNQLGQPIEHKFITEHNFENKVFPEIICCCVVVNQSIYHQTPVMKNLYYTVAISGTIACSDWLRRVSIIVIFRIGPASKMNSRQSHHSKVFRYLGKHNLLYFKLLQFTLLAQNNDLATSDNYLSDGFGSRS